MVNNLNAKNASTATNSSTTNNHRNNHNRTHYLTEVELIDPKLIVHRPKVRSLWYHCILYCLNQLKNGTSILLSDVDNISYRHIPLSDFQASPYDAIYSLSERYPTKFFDKQGFTLCGGMTFLKASNANAVV